MSTIISAEVGDAMMDVAHIPSNLALPTCLFCTGNLPDATGAAKENKCGCSRAAALCLVAAPAAEPSKSSQGEGLHGGKSKRGATLEASQHRKTEASQALSGWDRLMGRDEGAGEKLSQRRESLHYLLGVWHRATHHQSLRGLLGCSLSLTDGL